MTTPRDYAAEMNAALAQVAPAGDYVLGVLAGEFVDKLRVNDPELLAGWLDLHAAPVVADLLGRHLRAARQRQRNQASAGAFSNAAAAHAAGDAEALSPFEVRFVVDADETWRRVGDMTGPDHLFVAARYRQQEATAAMLAAFHAAVAKRVGKRTTAAVLSAEQYGRLYRSITGGQQAGAA